MFSQALYGSAALVRYCCGRMVCIFLLLVFCAPVKSQSSGTRSINLTASDFASDRQDPGIQFSSQGFTLPYIHLTMWSKKELYDLDRVPSVTFEFEALLTAQEQEIIIAFSQNKLPWGQPAADALTVRVTPLDPRPWFRTGFYGKSLENLIQTAPDEELLRVQEWQRYKIQFTPQQIIFSAAGREIDRANLNDAVFPRKGFIGFIVVGSPEIAETMIYYQNFVLQGMPESAEAETRGLMPSGPSTASSAEAGLATPGRYYALVIAVQDYLDDKVNDLDYPIQDAQNMIAALTAQYTFEAPDVTFLKNPTKDQVSNAFDGLINQVTERDNLLIFYAGHGFWDERLKQGFWLPADAKKDFRSNWMSNGTIRDYINGIRSKHTLLISDACFSGGIFKTRAAFGPPDRALEELYKTPSRKAMTSGAMKEVPDKSVFVSFLIKKLQENAMPYMPVQTLFTRLREPVINNSPNSQVPQFGVIRETGDEDGEFVFIRRK